MPRLQLPDPSLLGDKFGILAKYRKNAHRGTDWVLPEGTIVHAFSDGKITNILWSDALGWVVEQCDASGKWFIGYCHLQEKPKTIKVGTVIKQGQPIGHSGNTGSASTGPHLHVTISNSKLGVISGKVFDILKLAKKWK